MPVFFALASRPGERRPRRVAAPSLSRFDRKRRIDKRTRLGTAKRAERRRQEKTAAAKSASADEAGQEPFSPWQAHTEGASPREPARSEGSAEKGLTVDRSPRSIARRARLLPQIVYGELKDRRCEARVSVVDQPQRSLEPHIGEPFANFDRKINHDHFSSSVM